MFWAYFKYFNLNGCKAGFPCKYLYNKALRLYTLIYVYPVISHLHDKCNASTWNWLQFIYCLYSAGSPGRLKVNAQNDKSEKEIHELKMFLFSTLEILGMQIILGTKISLLEDSLHEDMDRTENNFTALHSAFSFIF